MTSEATHARRAMKLFDRYMKMLELTGWQINMHLATKEGMGDLSAGCTTYEGAKMVNVFIHEDPNYYPEDPNESESLEQSMAHEALHVLFNTMGDDIIKHSFGKTQAAQYKLYEENLIDYLARILVHASTD